MTTDSGPKPSPEQAVHVIEILSQWIERGWSYQPITYGPVSGVLYSDPENSDYMLDSRGQNHFDALCQATSAMQLLLELYPKKGS